MGNLRRWSTTATGNATVAGGVNTINFAEGQTPGSVNNSNREMMAQVRGIYTPSDWGWVENSATASVASQTTFKLAGNQTTDWATGRRWRLKSGSTTRYGSVVSSSYTSETTVTVTVDSGSLSASHSLAALSVIDASSNQLPGATQSFLRNRIINGDMRIDQRNAGASVTPTAGQYTLDRWVAGLTQASKYSVQRSSTAPTGHINSMLVTSLSAYSVLTGDTFLMSQCIEGYNVSDLGWGAAGAQSITLSFWVRSSLTGTFGGSVSNSAQNRSYPFSYTISSANTFEQKTVTIPGDTTGTWLTDNGIGIFLRFGLGSGATFSGTSGAWAAGNLIQPTGTVSVVGTNGATFYITGVQLEAGTVATPFERRMYGQELALCQRYYCAGISRWDGDVSRTATNYTTPVALPVTMRTNPTIGQTNSAATSFSTTTGTAQIQTSLFYDLRSSTAVAAGVWVTTWTASAEL